MSHILKCQENDRFNEKRVRKGKWEGDGDWKATPPPPKKKTQGRKEDRGRDKKRTQLGGRELESKRKGAGAGAEGWLVPGGLE